MEVTRWKMMESGGRGGHGRGRGGHTRDAYTKQADVERGKENMKINAGRKGRNRKR